MNAVVQRMSQLSGRNYVVKATIKEGWHHWFHNWYAGQIESRCEETGGDFYLIVYGSETDEKDFYVFPYDAVKHAFTDENLHKEPKYPNRRRWIGQIRNGKFFLAVRDTGIDLSPYYGNLQHLEYAADGFRPAPELSPDEADTPDEDAAPYAPTDEDSRVTVQRQIKARRGQQAFRDALRDRYGDLCLVSGCRLVDIVEAAHIKPYRGEQDNDPANGLLLRADLHTLFDLNLLGIEPDTLTVRVHPSAQEEGYAEFDGIELRCSGVRPSGAALALRWKAFQQKLGEQPAGVVLVAKG